MKKLLLTFITGLMIFPASAIDNVNKMKVIMTDGSEIVYTLKEQPVISFSSDDLTVTVNGQVYKHPLSLLQRYEIIAPNAAGIENIDTDRQEITRDGNVLTIKRTAAGAEIAIYGIGGELIYSTKADSQGNAKLNLEQLGSGIYILNVNGIATKISKL